MWMHISTQAGREWRAGGKGEEGEERGGGERLRGLCLVSAPRIPPPAGQASDPPHCAWDWGRCLGRYRPSAPRLRWQMQGGRSLDGAVHSVRLLQVHLPLTLARWRGCSAVLPTESNTTNTETLLHTVACEPRRFSRDCRFKGRVLFGRDADGPHHHAHHTLHTA